MRVAFVYYDYPSFVHQDYEILSRHFDVEKVQYRRPGDAFRMASSISRSDITFSWFASGHSFLSVMLSKLFEKRSVVVAGGYDVAFVPEIGYGQYTQGWMKRKYTDLTLTNADAVLAVSQFTEGEVLKKARPRRLEVVYNGVDTKKFRPVGEKEDLAITVASGSTKLHSSSVLASRRLRGRRMPLHDGSGVPRQKGSACMGLARSWNRMRHA